VWDVEQVRVDNRDAQSWNYTPDDPLLVGRTLVISSERVKFNKRKRLECVASAWEPQQTTWGALFSKGFAAGRREGERATTFPSDYDTKVPRGGTTTAYVLCPEAKVARNRFPNAPWIAFQSPGQLLLRLDNMTLLVLRRRGPNASPKASFDCQKTTTPTEKAICASYDLASWDRSVTAAFRAAISKREPDEVARIRAEQKAWLRERDACGTAVACIDEQQQTRVSDLTHP